jgi:hypothetical protein
MTKVDLDEIIDTLYWVSARSEHYSFWNTDIFNHLARVNEEEYE